MPLSGYRGCVSGAVHWPQRRGMRRSRGLRTKRQARDRLGGGGRWIRARGPSREGRAERSNKPSCQPGKAVVSARHREIDLRRDRLAGGANGPQTLGICPKEDGLFETVLTDRRLPASVARRGTGNLPWHRDLDVGGQTCCWPTLREARDWSGAEPAFGPNFKTQRRPVKRPLY